MSRPRQDIRRVEIQLFKSVLACVRLQFFEELLPDPAALYGRLDRHAANVKPLAIGQTGDGPDSLTVKLRHPYRTFRKSRADLIGLGSGVLERSRRILRLKRRKALVDQVRDQL